MKRKNTARFPRGFLWLLVCIVAFSPVSAFAYVGPGAGITLLGSLLSLIMAILFVGLGILVWPIRVLWRKIKGKRKEEKPSDEPARKDEEKNKTDTKNE